MLRRSIPFLLFVSAPLALALAGVGTTACGGCYIDGDSTDVTVDPPSACLTVVAGHSTNGCSGPGPTGVKVTNCCSEPLVLGKTTIAPGQRDVAVGSSPPTGGDHRSLSGTLGGKPITIRWLDAVEAAERSKTDAATDG